MYEKTYRELQGKSYLSFVTRLLKMAWQRYSSRTKVQEFPRLKDFGSCKTLSNFYLAQKFLYNREER